MALKVRVDTTRMLSAGPVIISLLAFPVQACEPLPVEQSPIIISLLAFLVSLLGLAYTARTYAVSHRPYLGIVDMPFQLVENPPRAIVWKMVVKNVGSLPAFMTVQENSARLATPAGTSTLASLGAIGRAGTMVMPGQTVDLLGQYTEVGGPVPMSDILSGTAALNITVRLTYEFPSWLRAGRRYYNADVLFHVVEGVAPGFTMISAEAN